MERLHTQPQSTLCMERLHEKALHLTKAVHEQLNRSTEYSSATLLKFQLLYVEIFFFHSQAGHCSCPKAESAEPSLYRVAILAWKTLRLLSHGLFLLYTTKPNAIMKRSAQTARVDDRAYIQQPVSCQFCRSRKLKCDRGRPSCFNCSSRSKDCIYEAGKPYEIIFRGQVISNYNSTLLDKKLIAARPAPHTAFPIGNDKNCLPYP